MKKRFGLLLILLLTPLLLVGVVQSVVPPSIYINVSSYGINVIGSGWTAYADVTIYYDVEDADHMVATVKANYAGNFQVYIPTNYVATVGTHTVIAVQGVDMATAVYDVGAASPPDDRLLNPILSIKDKLDDVDTEVKAIEAKLDAGGSFYNFVNAWFVTVDDKIDIVDDKVDIVDNKVDVIEGKVDIVDGKVDTLQGDVDDVKDQLDDKLEILAYYEGQWNYDGDSDYLYVPGTRIQTDQPVLFTVTYALQNWDDEDFTFHLTSSASMVRWLFDVDTDFVEQAVTFPGTSMHMNLYVDEDNPDFDVYWGIMVRGTPGTVVTVLNPP